MTPQETQPGQTAAYDDAAPKTQAGNREGIDKKLFEIHPALKYLGFSLLLVYHYILWFVPDSFYNTQLLSTQVTYAWIVNLAATALAMLVAALYTGRTKHLSDARWLIYVLPVALVVCTILLEYLPAFFPGHLIITLLAVATGIIEGLIWILWGEYLTRTKAKFSMIHIGTVFSSLLICSMLIGVVIPSVATPLFVAAIAAVSGYLLVLNNRSSDDAFPQLLPRKTTKKVVDVIVTICSISFVTSAACYFLTAIVPWEELPFEQDSFTLGVIVGGAVLLVTSLAFVPTKGRISIIKAFPYLLVLSIVGLSLFLTDSSFNFVAFLIALCVSSLLEISLLMYFGTLTQRGYFPPAFAFALSVISVRLGIMVGNGLALFYEANALVDSHGPITALVFVCLLTILLVPMSKRESILISLTSAPISPAQVDVVCQQIADEFGLSERESEILRLIARNNTANAIAQKLVISPHTVNTHIRHIYEKVQIHKRSELLEYINMRRNDG